MKKVYTLAVLFFKRNSRIKTVISILLILFGCWMFMFYESGAAANGTAVTGAPFNSNNTCAGCHGGGNFGGSIATSLLDASNNMVTMYEPGKAYTFQIVMSHTTGAPLHGFQTTSATAAGTDVNGWGTMPAHTHSTVLHSHTYAEQSAALNDGTIKIPWTGPAAHTGAVTFYTSGNLVDGDFSSSGDQPVNNSLEIQENTSMPVTLLYFNGSIVKAQAVLHWATGQEVNNKNFVLEKSLDGSKYLQLATILAKGNSSAGYVYSYTDANFNTLAYYRLKQVDMDGNVNVYNTVKLKVSSGADYTLSVFAFGGKTGVIFYNANQQQKINVRCINMQGKVYYSYDVLANEGNNFLPVSGLHSREIVIVVVTTESGIRKSIKLATAE